MWAPSRRYKNPCLCGLSPVVAIQGSEGSVSVSAGPRGRPALPARSAVLCSNQLGLIPCHTAPCQHRLHQTCCRGQVAGGEGGEIGGAGAEPRCRWAAGFLSALGQHLLPCISCVSASTAGPADPAPATGPGFSGRLANPTTLQLWYHFSSRPANPPARQPWAPASLAGWLTLPLRGHGVPTLDRPAGHSGETERSST